MTTKIDKKIVKYSVLKEEEKETSSPAAQGEESEETSNVIHMHEKIERPDRLLGSTYKVKTPLSEHALYVTINDVSAVKSANLNKYQPNHEPPSA